jgi:hypothetical protein
MTAPSRPKTLKTRCIAAGVAAALTLGSCAISVSIRELHVELCPAAAPAPKPQPLPKAPPVKERVINWLEQNRKRGGRIAVVRRPYRAATARLRSEGKKVTQIARALSIRRESVHRIEKEMKRRLSFKERSVSLSS